MLKRVFINRGNLARNATTHQGRPVEPPIAVQTEHGIHSGFEARIASASRIVYQPRAADDIDTGLPVLWLETDGPVVLDDGEPIL